MGLLQTVVRCGAVGFRVLSTRERVGYIALLWRLVEGNEARIGGDLRVCHCGAFEFEGVVEKDDFWWKREWLLTLGPSSPQILKFSNSFILALH